MRKRAVSVLLCLAMILSFLPALSVPARAVVSLPYYRDHIFYDARTGDVIGFEATNSASTNYVVQDTVNGHKVTKICEYAFWGVLPDDSTCTISIPDSVTSIESGAFGEADDMAKIENIVCSENSAAQKYAQENNIKALTPEQNQRLIDSKTFLTKSLTVKINTKDAGDRTNSYIAAEKAVITVYEPDSNGDLQESETYTVPSSGVVEIKASNAANVKITRAGGIKITGGISSSYIDLYIGEAVPWEKTFKDIAENETVYLDQKTDKLYIKSVIATVDVDGTVEDFDIYYDNIVLDTFSSDPVTITADINWNGHGAGQIYLYQGGYEKAFDGTKLTTVLKDGFDIRETLQIKAVAADGTQIIKPVKIEPIEGWLDEWLSGSGLSFMDGASLTLPDKIPFAGGSSISISKLSLPIDVGYEGAKIYVSVNAFAADYSKDYKKTDPDKATEKDAKLFGFELIKKAVNGEDKKTLSQLWEEAKKKSETGTKSNSFSFDVLGYFEFTVRPDKNLKISDGQIIVKAGYKFSTSGQFPAPATFLYWEFYFKIDAEGKLSLVQIISPNGVPFRPYGSFAVEGAIGVGGGVGAREVLSAGVGGEGSTKVSFTWKNAGTFYKWGGKFDVYAHANLLMLEWKKSWTVAQGTWMEGQIGGTETASLAWDMAELQEMYDPGQYTVQDQSYLDQGMEFNANDVALLGDDGSLSEFVSNVYNMPHASIVKLDDGTQLMVWLAGVENRTNGNKTAVYYSVCQGDGVWSAPSVIWDDGTADFQPVVIASGNTAFVAWQNLKETVAADTSGVVDEALLATAAEKCEIAAARFQNGTFDLKQNLTDDDYYDCCPVLSAEDGSFELVWLRDENNSPMGNSDQMRVMRASGSGDSWSASSAISDYGMISTLDACGAGESFRWAYTCDLDSDLNTADDLEIYLNGVRLTNNDYADDLPCFAERRLYWMHDGILCSEDDPETSIIGENISISSSDVRVYDNGEGMRAVVYSSGSDENNGAKSELFGIFIDDQAGTVSAPVALTDCGGNTQCGIGYYDGQSLILPCAVTEVTGTISETESDDVLPFGSTDLNLLNYIGDNSLSINDIYVEYDRAVPGNNYCVNVEIQNSGALAATGYSVILWDTNSILPDDFFKGDYGSGSSKRIVAEVFVDEPLAGGSSAVTELWFRLPETAFAGDYEVTVTPVFSDSTFSETECYNNADDRQTCKLYSEDLLVEQAEAVNVGDGESMTLNALIANVGMNTQNNVKVNLYSLDEVETVDEDGETIIMTQRTLRDSAIIPSLAASDHTTVSFIRAIDECDSYVFQIEQGTGEGSLTNNELVCAVLLDDNQEPLSATLSVDGETLSGTVSINRTEDLEGTPLVAMVAAYNDAGRMITATTLDLGNSDTKTYRLTAADTASVKYFLVKADGYVPMYEALEKVIPD